MNIISIIICTHNRAGYLAQAIESVLSQSYKNIEIIIIDDASTDNTTEILRKYTDDARIRVIQNTENLGISKSRNEGVRLATGKYIAMLDSDDYWCDQKKLEKQVHLLNEDRAIGLVGSSAAIIDNTGNTLKYIHALTDDASIRAHILSKNQFVQSTVVFTKDVFERVGGYDEKLLVDEDFDLWLRIGLISKFANLSDITTAYRIHSNNISKDTYLMAYTVNQIINRYKSRYPNYYFAKIKSFIRITLSHFSK